jgi:hypothetical protein
LPGGGRRHAICKKPPGLWGFLGILKTEHVFV